MNMHTWTRQIVLAMALFSGSLTAYAVESTPAAAQAEAAAQALSVNINTANAEELADLLNGVGLSRAQAIIEYREQHGPFRSAEDLTMVRGIGAATLERNLSVIRVQ